MARIPIKGLPWLTLAELAIGARSRWRRLEEDDRAELGRLVRKATTGPRTLAPHERTELRRLVAALDLVDLGLGAVPFGKRARRVTKLARRARR